jgi:alpha-beta hydrolase superfamily lysophospholipase
LADGPVLWEEFTASDGYRWHYLRYVPAGPTRAEVVCLHGIQSHAGWYGYSCRRLQQAGYAVSFLERRGAGRNQAERGDARGGFPRLLDDIAEYLHARRAAQKEPLPLFLIAISWGGRLGVALQRRHPGLVEGLALLCPGFFPQVRAARGTAWQVAWARLVAPQRLFPIPLNDPALFTATPHWQEFIRQDPLALRQATARFLFTNNRLSRYLWLVPRHVHLPVLLLLAGQDRIIDNDRTRRYVARFASPDKQIKEYPQAHHTLEFEPEPDMFVNDLLDWLDRQTAAWRAAGRPVAAPARAPA